MKTVRNGLVGALLAMGLATSVLSAARAQSPEDIVLSDVRISDSIVRPGQVVRVRMTLRNQGPVIARSQPPAPSTVYTQGEDFAERGFETQPDRFHIVMTLSGEQGDEWPYRWGLGGNLKLGEIRTVSYPIRLTRPGIYTIYVGVAYGDQVQRMPASNLTGIEVVAPGARPRTSARLIDPTPPTRLVVNGEEVQIDQRPVFAEATVLVPIRFVMEELGAYVDWDPRTRTVTASRGDYRMVLNVGKSDHSVNGRPGYTYVNPRIVDGRTMVPIRFVAEGLGGKVAWIAATKTVDITMPPLPTASTSPATE